MSKKRIEMKQEYIGCKLTDKIVLSEDMADTIIRCFETVKQVNMNRPLMFPNMSAAVFTVTVLVNGNPVDVTLTVTRDVFNLDTGKWDPGGFRFGGVRPDSALFTSRKWLEKRMKQKGWL